MHNAMQKLQIVIMAHWRDTSFVLFVCALVFFLLVFFVFFYFGTIVVKRWRVWQ